MSLPLPLRRALRSVALLLVVVALGLGFLLWRGPEPGGIEDVYASVFGKPDLGPVDFATLTRRSTPNDALACPPGICPKAEADMVPPVFPVPGDRLRAIVAEVASEDAETRPTFESNWGEEDRYLARSRIMRYPDTINVQIVGQGEGRSTLALYSRSQIGLSDFGVNRARIERWLKRIGEIAAQPAAVSEG